MNISYIRSKEITIFDSVKNSYLVFISQNSAIEVKILANQTKLDNLELKDFYVFTHFCNSKTFSINYYGFAKKSELVIFKKLLNIKGIGIKLATEIFYLYLENNININTLSKYAKISPTTPKNIKNIFT